VTTPGAAAAASGTFARPEEPRTGPRPGEPRRPARPVPAAGGS